MTTNQPLIRISSLVSIEGYRSARIGEAVSLTPVSTDDLISALAQQKLFERIRDDHQQAMWTSMAITRPLWDMYRLSRRVQGNELT